MRVSYLEVLAALHENQPATAKFLVFLTGLSLDTVKSALLCVVDAGLVWRERDPERLGEPGSAPYVYHLTDKGAPIAKALTEADRAIEGVMDKGRAA